MASSRRTDPPPEEEPGDPGTPKFGPRELGPDSGVYFIEQLLRPDAEPTNDTEADTADEATRPSPLLDAVPADDGRLVPQGVGLPVRRRAQSPLVRQLAVVLAVLVVVSLGLGAAVVAKQAADAAAAHRAAERFSAVQASTSTVVVIGDESDLHSLGSAPDSEQWPAILRSDLRGHLVELSSPGAGYSSAAASGRTFLAEAARVPRDATVVVFLGGAADRDVSPMRLLKAATRAFSIAGQQAPNARVIAVGPLPGPDVTTKGTRRLRQALRVSAATAGITWADPIDAGWLPASAAPTPADERTIAARVAAIIHTPSPSPTP